MSENIQLAGFGGRFRATESLWSIGSKIGWANRISGVSLFRTINRPNSGSIPNFLITGLKFDFERMAKVTGIPVTTLRNGTGLSLTRDTTLLAELAFPHLRYCPRCMAEGFHSILYQFPLFSCCPRHGDRLEERCTCGGAIAHKWPGGQRTAFMCEHCERSLWQPSQGRFAQDPADALFSDLQAWAVDWIARTLKFTNSGAPLRRWVQTHDEARWTALGLSDMAGVFSPRALRAHDEDYWGSRHVIKRDSLDGYMTASETYLDVLDELGGRLGIPVRECGSWIADYQAKPVRRDTAFVVWRCFWEGLTEVPELADDSRLIQRAELTMAIVGTYFRKMLVPGGYSERELGIVNAMVLRSLLHATFVHSFLTVGPRMRAGRLLQELPAAPLPIFLVKPTDHSIVVEWVHQRVIGKGTRSIFG